MIEGACYEARIQPERCIKIVLLCPEWSGGGEAWSIGLDDSVFNHGGRVASFPYFGWAGNSAS